MGLFGGRRMHRDDQDRHVYSGGGPSSGNVNATAMEDRTREMMERDSPRAAYRKAGLLGGNAPGGVINKADLGPEVLGTPQPEPDRGFLGDIAHRVGNGFERFGKFMNHDEEDGRTNWDRLALAAAAMRDDPRYMALVQDRFDTEDARQQQDTADLRARKDQHSLHQQAVALVNEQAPGNRALLNEAMRNPGQVISMLAERSMQTPDAPQTRERVEGGSTVVEQFNPQAGVWDEVSRGPRWNPNSRSGSDRTSVGDIGGQLLDKIARGETLTASEQRAFEEYQNLRRAPDPFAQMFGQTGAAGGSGPSTAPRGGGSDDEPARIQTQADFDALPSGALYVNPADGETYRKN